MEMFDIAPTEATPQRGLRAHWQKKNMVSLDGITGLTEAIHSEKEFRAQNHVISKSKQSSTVEPSSDKTVKWEWIPNVSAGFGDGKMAFGFALGVVAAAACLKALGFHRG
jgi:hypothetical protein